VICYFYRTSSHWHSKYPHLTDSNTGLYELDSQASVDVDLLVHEQYIFGALLAARALPGTKSLDEPRQKILDRVIGELQRISLIRGRNGIAN